jgi:hypothetical protein
MLNYETLYERLVFLYTRFSRLTVAEEDIRA